MIPVYEPQINEADIEAVLDVLRRGEVSGTVGETIARFEDEFAHHVGSRHAIAVNSGTSALHLAVAALDLQPGDEVLLSASTNVATALAVFHNGLRPVPVDADPVSWNLDLTLIEGLVGERTKALIPVHLFGNPVDMGSLMEIADRHGLVVIEDCAQSLGATWQGRPTGGFSLMGCFSFYANKVVTTGEGGMIVTDDAGLAVRLRGLRNLAFSEPRFVHHEAGFNFRMPALNAALGRSQLARVDETVAAKRRIADLYRERLEGVPGLQLPEEHADAKHVYWMFPVVIEEEAAADRDHVMKSLAAEGIDSRTFFCPMDQQPFLQQQVGARLPVCPIAGGLWRRGMYLPSSPRLDESAIDRITASLTASLV